ncbi:MAG: hydroxymethylglutaryl-CoA lyase, partial [Saprospiraceae bacterium]
KIDAAYKSGCRRFDAAIKGYGGCPMAKDDLTGNMATENLLQYFEDKNINLSLDKIEFGKAMNLALKIFK